jgi:hypothetical protein
MAGKPLPASNRYSFSAGIFRDRIIPMSSPWMTPGDPFHAKPYAFQGSPFYDSLHGILGAGGSMPAVVAQVGRNGGLVNSDHADKNSGK